MPDNLAGYEISRVDANDICWNHMRSIVISQSTVTLDRLLRIANNLYSGTQAMQVTAEITEAVRVIKTREDAQAEASMSPGEEAGKAADTADRLNNRCGADASSPMYRDDAAHHLLKAFTEAKRTGRLSSVVRGFNRLAEMDGYRVHKLLISLKRGRQGDVLNALEVFTG